MSFRWKVHTPAVESDVSVSINDYKPLRIALLGGPKSGKSSFASRLSTDSIPDTYYPTHSTNTILFQFVPKFDDSRAILDPSDTFFNEQIDKKQESRRRKWANQKLILLSPVIEELYTRNLPSRTKSQKGTTPSIPPTSDDIQRKKVQEYKVEVADWILKGRTEYYKCVENRQDVLDNPHEKNPPNISPILVEFIDTPPFNPDKVVPFLEASLYMKLDPEILRNLANEPRKPVSTNPLLVASGAGEMNGYVDGYFFVYSAIPSYNPPSYDESINKTEYVTKRKLSTTAEKSSQEQAAIDQVRAETIAQAKAKAKSSDLTASPGKYPSQRLSPRPGLSHQQSSNSIISVSSEISASSDVIEESPGDSTFQLLLTIKNALEDAWREYSDYAKGWKKGQEGDVFSIKGAFKSIWKKSETSQQQQPSRLRLSHTPEEGSSANYFDPADPYSPPPIWLICTHVDSELASPQLIENGMKLAKFWNCGFIGVDSTTDEGNVEEALSLLIREIVERKKLQRKKK